MKILFLNPRIDAEHKISKRLQSSGIAVLFPADAGEAIQMLKLHGTSIDLAIIHREGHDGGNSDLGLKFISKVQTDPLQADLPVILTSETWGDVECARHQKSPEGVNAYLRFPFTDDQLIQTIEAVLGQPVSSSQKTSQNTKADAPSKPSASAPPQKKSEPKKPEPKKAPPKASPKREDTHTNTDTDTSTSGPVLEDASHVFMKPEEDPTGSHETNIFLEAPDIDFETPGSSIPQAAEPSLPVASEAPPPPPVSEELSQAMSLDLPDPSSPVEFASPEPMSASELPSAVMSISDAPMSLALPSLGGGSSLEDALDAPAALDAALDAPADQGAELSLPTAVDSGLMVDGLEPIIPTAIGIGVSSLDTSALTRSALPPVPGDEEPSDEKAEPTSSADLDDPEVAREMPYLFNETQKKGRLSHMDPSLLFAEPLGDAVVPGGAAQPPDLETFKKYLLLREQDVAVLSNQLKAAHDQIKLIEQQLRDERARNTELNHVGNEQEHKIKDFEKEKNLAIDELQSEIEELRFQVKAKSDKARVLDNQVRETAEEMEHLKERVRTDIRKIRVREKELENRLEIMKKDSEALISARENKIIELKRKLDLLEFNMDLLQDQYGREKENAGKLRERLARAAQIVRVAGGLLDTPKDAAKDNQTTESDTDATGEKEREAS